ncbi:hypothetical protein BDW74DRAFT_172348 [Aspergillus multicolor]|uniref:uncharacterized protein n=1 Tax=Aspergillus multicolor TaxID=41759 RepID=UPI003CCDC6F7
MISSNDAAPEVWQSLVQKGKGLVSIVDKTDEVFDLVVVSTDAQLPCFSERVAEDGYLFASGSPISDISSLQSFYSSSNVRVWHNKPLTSSPANTALTIMMPNNPTAATRDLANLIKLRSMVPTTEVDFLSLSEGAKNVQGDVVVLASLDANLHFDQDSASVEFRAAQALLTRQGNGNIVWLTRGGLMDVSSPEQALILGLCRSARSENPNLRLVVFGITPSFRICPCAKLTCRLLDQSIAENEVVERDGRLYIARVVAADDLNCKVLNGVGSELTIQPLYQKDRPLNLRIGRPGFLDTLVFSDDLELSTKPLQPDELEIEVKASALNFRDIAAGMGITEGFKLGDECAGVVVRVGTGVSPSAFAVGDRVVAWRPGQGAHRTVLRNPASLCYKLQVGMPFAVASSIPLVLTTAYYSLVDIARLRPDETVLIHSAAGGVGQMAVQIAQNIGARVIATVGSAEKRVLLIEKYGLDDLAIFSSRDNSFVEGIHTLTNGRGFDVALNSLADSLLLSTWESIAPFGRFVEIGKRDIYQNSRIPMDPFRRNVSFASVDRITIFEKNEPRGARVFQDSCTLVHEGKIQPPYPITEVTYGEAQRAFRMLQTGTTSGKVVLIPHPDDQVLVEPTQFRRRTLFDENKTYLLVRGLGGLGRRLSEWLYQRGARHLAFLARSGAKRAGARDTVQWLQDRGVNVAVFSGDVSEALVVKDVIHHIKATPYRLAGVFHAGMVLHDAPLPQIVSRNGSVA